MLGYVCIIGEADSDPTLVENVLANDFEVIGTPVTIDEAVQLCDEQPPDVLIFAYYSLAEIEDDYIRFLRKARAIHSHPFRSLLLCSGRDAESAYALCCKSVFDDYLVNQPLQDAFQLRWAVRCAFETLKNNHGEPNTLDGSLAYDQCRDVLGNQMEGLASIASANQALIENEPAISARLSKELARLVGELGKSMDAGHFNDALTVKDTGALLQHLTHFSQTQISPLVSKAQSLMSRQLQEIGTALNNQHTSLSEADQVLHQASAANHKPVILLVDDDDQYRETLEDWLDESGYRVISASNVYSAIALAQKTRPDLVLMDYMMPGMNGIETSKLLNQIVVDEADLPVIMLTGYGSRGLVEEAIGIGIVDFALKTTRFNHLDEKIKSHLPRTYNKK